MEHISEVPKDFINIFQEYYTFVMGRVHVLVHQPDLTFSMAYSLPSSSVVAQQAHHRFVLNSFYFSFLFFLLLSSISFLLFLTFSRFLFFSPPSVSLSYTHFPGTSALTWKTARSWNGEIKCKLRTRVSWHLISMRFQLLILFYFQEKKKSLPPRKIGVWK